MNLLPQLNATTWLAICIVLALLIQLVALHFFFKLQAAHKSAPPARTYDAALMQRQISKLQRVASQTYAPSIASCTGKCNQGRNCTCSGQSKGQL